MNSAPGRSVPSSAPAELEQQLGLQRIGVLELVDEDDAEALAELAAHLRVVAHEVARLDQQIEKIERARFLLARLVAAQALAHLVVQQGGKVGIGRVAKRAQLLQQLGVRGQRLIAGHADRERGRRSPSSDCAKSRSSASATSAASQPSHIPSGTMSPTIRFWRSISALVVARLRERLRETRSSRLIGLRDQIGERLQLRHERLDRRLAIVRWPAPRRRVVAPLAQAARRRRAAARSVRPRCRRQTAT